MNKKIIAIAVAAAFTAPVAMADVKMSGRVNQQFVQIDTDSKSAAADTDSAVLDNFDSGQARLQFDITSGDAYGRLAMDERFGRDRLRSTYDTADRTTRDQYVGYKFGASSLQYGRMGGASKNIEKDPLIGTFLEVRSNNVASASPSSRYDSSAFVDEVLQFKTKAGAVNINVQIGMSDGDATASTSAQTRTGDNNQGYVGIGISGKAAGVRWFVSSNNGFAELGEQTDDTPKNDDNNVKIGASMKFGKVKASLTIKQSEVASGVGTKTEDEVIVLRANMGFGNGLTGYAAYAMNTVSNTGLADNDGTYIRLGVSKKLAKGVSLYGGYTATSWDATAPNTGNSDVTQIGAGMTLKF